MATRLIDFPALWSSDKLFACAAETRCEYAWLYGLADAHGSFELTNLRVIHGRVSPIRDDLTLEKLSLCVKEFNEHGLLFIWQQDGKRYGHWTNSEGRLPAKSLRDRYVRFAPPVPDKELHEYLAGFSGPNLEQVKTASRCSQDKLLRLSCLGYGDGDGKPSSSETPVSDGAHPKSSQRKPTSEPEGFAEFWRRYPRKVAKAAALKAWRKLNGVDLKTVLAALDVMKQSAEWQKDEGQFIPHPATWLNGRRWEDELTVPAPSNRTAAQPVPMPQRLPRPELNDVGRQIYERAGVSV
jgi:hypothetical protein